MSTLIERHRPLRRFSFGDKSNLVIRLVLANLIIFAAFFFIKMMLKVTGGVSSGSGTGAQITPWAVLPADFMKLLSRPWTLITYMFVHTDFWLLLSCMIWLWGFGQLLQGLYGSKVILPIYILGGLAGAVTFLLAYQVIPSMAEAKATATSLHIGASASVMAIVVCTTMLLPQYRVFPMLGGGISLYVIFLIYLLFIFLGKEGNALFGYLAADVGGALLGVYFGYRIKNGDDPGRMINQLIFKFSHVFEPKKTHFSAENIEGRKDNPQRAYEQVGAASEIRIDEILDKINSEGIDSLTKEEKEILRKASKGK